MEPEQRLLEIFKPRSETEAVWLKNFYTFVLQHLSCGPTPSEEAVSLTVSAVQSVQQKFDSALSLPVSYRPLSVSELVSQQRLSCVSNLSWSTSQHRAWSREAELTVTGQTAHGRVNLLLIGHLTEGKNGRWTLTDSSGSVLCECLSPSPLWLHRLVFLPHWHYIPHDAAEGPDEDRGHLELIGPPVLLSVHAATGLAARPGEGTGPVGAMGVQEAFGFLQNRVKGQRLCVYGEVGFVCPLLVVSGISFFCWSLTEDGVTLPVLVKESHALPWFPCLRVGLRVCVTELRVCVLRGWRGNNILCVTERSELHANYTHTHVRADVHSKSDSPLPMMSPNEMAGCEEAVPEKDSGQSDVSISRVISYQGTVTEVTSEGAGLYVLDGKVGLCLAYQPRWRRSLRAGDRVELRHVHVLLRPCPDLPPSMLCACLRSSVRVTAFSRVGGAPPSPDRCPGDGALPRLLLQTNCSLSDYLWTCHLSSRLALSLVPAVSQQQQCVCLLSWRLMEMLRGRRGRGHRDIYSEMLDELHTCPVSQYSADPSAHQHLDISKLCTSLQDVWSSVSLGSLLSSDGPNMTRSQINSALSWSSRTLSSDPRDGDALRRRPLLLVGLFQLPSPTSDLTLQLSDGTGVVSCVVTETSRADGAFCNTAWIGCLVCVQRFTMVTERFLQSEFPSFQHLDQDKFITHSRCRAYLQFSLDHVHVLSPSVAMETHLSQKGAESAEGGAESSVRKKRRTEEKETPAVATPQPPPLCVSVVIRAEQKRGVAWKNVGAWQDEENPGLRLSFSVTASVIGPVVTWQHDPKNGTMAEREADKEGRSKVLLEFSGRSSRWFPLIQPGTFYRLVVLNCQNCSLLIGSEPPGRRRGELHTEAVLQVASDWKLHTLTRPLHTCELAVLSPVLSVSQVLQCRVRSQLVCFQGLVSERTSLNDRNKISRDTYTGVRLTVCDQTGRSLQIYLDLSHTPYPPGLLPGNTLLFSAFQRRVSRTGSVYCSFLPVSSMTVLSLGDSSCPCPPPPPIMHLGSWAHSEEHRCTVGRVKGHLVRFLMLEFQWSCSLCDSVYTQSCSGYGCRSSTSVFQSKAKAVMDDGTGEAHVWFSGVLVSSLLELAAAQWEGLQRALKVKGHIRLYPRGRVMVSDRHAHDSLLHFLSCVCSSDVVRRPVILTCRRRVDQRAEERKTFTRGDRSFATQLVRPVQLTCLHLHSSSN
ncbi:unnamed protein product [Ophioblennius macclurei]